MWCTVAPYYQTISGILQIHRYMYVHCLLWCITVKLLFFFVKSCEKFAFPEFCWRKSYNVCKINAEKWKIHLHFMAKIFREINSSYFFSQTVDFTEFFQKVSKLLHLRKLRNFTATIFSQKFRECNILLSKELYSKLIWRKKFAWQWIFRFSTLWCAHCGKMKNLLSPKFFSVKSTL